MNQASAVEQLESVQYLYLQELSEPRANALKLVVQEAKVNRSGHAKLDPEIAVRPELEAILKNSSPVESVEGSRTFELYWKHYAAYLVTEELVGSSSVSGYEDESSREEPSAFILDHIFWITWHGTLEATLSRFGTTK